MTSQGSGGQASGDVEEGADLGMDGALRHGEAALGEEPLGESVGPVLGPERLPRCTPFIPHSVTGNNSNCGSFAYQILSK